MTLRISHIVRRHLVQAIAPLLVVACGDATASRPLDPNESTVPGIEKPHPMTWNDGATLAWNQIARDLVVNNKTGPAPAVRVYALVSIAQDHAAAAATADHRAPQPSVTAAISGAAAAVLTYLYPADSAFIAAQLATLDHVAPEITEPSQSFTGGVVLGRTIAADVVAMARVDGFFAPFTGTVPSCPACWRAVPAPPQFATLGQARPFVLRSSNQFRPLPPPAFGSADFLGDLAEVRRISDSRTSKQDSIAKVWALQAGTVTTLGYWNDLAARFVKRHRLTETRAARVFALMNQAGYDALIASHEAKYTFWLLRPSQADAGILPAIGLPGFPSYPSNHATISSAAAVVLAEFFPAERESFLAVAAMAGESRILGGIHYRFDVTAGLRLGREVANYVLVSLKDRPSRQ